MREYPVLAVVGMNQLDAKEFYQELASTNPEIVFGKEVRLLSVGSVDGARGMLVDQYVFSPAADQHSQADRLRDQLALMTFWASEQ